MTKTYTTREAAAVLGITYDAILKRIKRAGLKPTKTFGPFRYWTMKQIESVKK